jgi:hypothetical protein
MLIITVAYLDKDNEEKNEPKDDSVKADSQMYDPERDAEKPIEVITLFSNDMISFIESVVW